MSIELKVKKVHECAILPKYQTDGAACFDLHSLLNATGAELAVRPEFPKEICTGLAFEVPEKHVLLIFSRSGHGFKDGVRLSNCVGVIDSDFRGEIKVKLHADLGRSMYPRGGDRIAQAMLLPTPTVNIVEVQELSVTQRGTGGFGSTGK